MKRLRLWLPVLAWAALIFTGSTDSFSSQHTGGFFLGFLHSLLPHASEATLDLLHLLIRKCGHFTEYFIFGLLILRALRAGSREWKLRWAMLALLLAISYASLDEFHQSFVPSRTASPWDVLIDGVGAAAAQVAVWTVSRRQSSSASEA